MQGRDGTQAPGCAVRDPAHAGGRPVRALALGLLLALLPPPASGGPASAHAVLPGATPVAAQEAATGDRAAAVPAAPEPSAQGPAPPEPATHAERTGWTELTPHEEVVAFYRELRRRSPEVRMAEIGRSREGRPLHLVTVARPGVASPWEAQASGKPILFIGAQVHGDEPAGKEGLMLFARDLVLGELNDLLDEVIVLMVPQINPDGAETGEWGIRANSAGYNLNRDYLRMDNPETRAVVEGVLVPWRPHVVVDAHELPGPPRVYDFYTWHPSNPHGPEATARLAAERAIPAIVEAIEGAGYSHIVYHVPGGIAQDPTAGISVPAYGRTLNDYAGAQGMITILYESLRERDARVDIEDRTRRQHIAMTALARYMAENPGEVLNAVAEGRREMQERGARWDPADSVNILREVVASREIDYRVAEMERVETEDGARWEPTGEIVTVRTPMRDSTVTTLARVRPVGYLIDRHRGELVEHLLAHGLEVERIEEPGRVRVESYRVREVATAPGPYEGYVPQEIAAETEERTVEVPEGAWLVRADQPGAALLFHLAEPEDENSWAITALFASEARPGGYLPVHRVREWPGVATRSLSRPEEVR